jgi:uncharacterized membrane protein YoaK (UPF0700 family)
MIHFDNMADVFKPKYIPLWLISAFKAGFINSAGFLITGKFVSHVTGFGTHAGIAIGHADYFFGAEILFIPVSFILGGVVTSWILDRNYRGRETPKYFLVQGLITLMIAIVILAGEMGIKEGDIFDADNRYSILELFICISLCFICGLKNSLVTWTTYGKIRVTHLTGTATDIGLNLIRTFKPKQPAPRFKESQRVNVVRIMTLLSFTAGACGSAVIIPMVGYKGFLLVFMISLIMTIISTRDYLSRREMTALASFRQGR